MNQPLRTFIIDTDTPWFRDHPDRKCRIRNVVGREQEVEFRSLGDHDEGRCRILAWKIPPDGRIAPGTILRIPFLAFADEEIRNDDATLLPILAEIMGAAAEEYGMVPQEGRA